MQNICRESHNHNHGTLKVVSWIKNYFYFLEEQPHFNMFGDFFGCVQECLNCVNFFMTEFAQIAFHPADVNSTCLS